MIDRLRLRHSGFLPKPVFSVGRYYGYQGSGARSARRAFLALDTCDALRGDSSPMRVTSDGPGIDAPSITVLIRQQISRRVWLALHALVHVFAAFLTARREPCRILKCSSDCMHFETSVVCHHVWHSVALDFANMHTRPKDKRRTKVKHSRPRQEVSTRADDAPPLYLTATELAARWKLSPSQAYNLIGTPGLTACATRQTTCPRTFRRRSHS